MSFVKRSLAATLIFSLTFSQYLWALDVRKLMADAKSSFDTPDRRRGGSVPSRELQRAQAQQEALISRQQALAELQDALPGAVSTATPVSTPNSGVFTPQLPAWDPVSPVPQEAVIIDSTNDTYFNQQWGLTAINAEQAWAFNHGEGVVAAIIDTGLDFLHPDIQSSIWSNADEIAGNGIDDDGNGFIDDARGWDFYNNDNDPTDDNGHGTHIAGIVAAAQNNSLGISGVAPGVKIMPLKVLNSSGGGLIANVFSAINSSIRYAADQGAKIINMSLGVPTYYYDAVSLAEFQSAIQYAEDKGTITVVSAGNNYGAIDVYPALFDNVITVGALYRASGTWYLKDSYSSTGPSLDFMAPGTDIISLRAKNTNPSYAYPYPNGDYIYYTGTSMAAPHVVGTVALLLAQDPFMSFDDIYRRLKFSSKYPFSSGYDTSRGYGNINAYNALSFDYYDTGVKKTQFLPAPDFLGAVRYDFDAAGTLVKKTLANGDQILLTYYSGTGNIKTLYYSASGDLEEYADENFSNGLGRMIKRTHADTTYSTYLYWYDSAQVRFQSDYNAAGALVTVTAYDESGNKIEGGGTPTLSQTVSAQSYTSSVGTLYKYSNGVLASYSNFTVNYALNIASTGAYALKFSAAQWTSKLPPPGYLFNFNIKVDGVLVANVNLNAYKTYTVSDFISLNTLSAGAHTLTIQWTNDSHPTPYDANAAIANLEIYQEQGGAIQPPTIPACDADACVYDPSNRLIESRFMDGRSIKHFFYVNTATRKSDVYFDPNILGGAMYKAILYYASGNEQGANFFDTNTSYTRFDENFYGNGKGRLSEVLNEVDKFLYVYYWPGTDTAGAIFYYQDKNSSDVPTEIIENNPLGNPIRHTWPALDQTEDLIYYPSNRVQQSIWTVSSTIAFLKQYDYYDESGYPQNRGRLARFTDQDGTYTTYEDYYGTTTVARFQNDYDAQGVLLVTREYDSAGNLIATVYPQPSANPVLSQTISAQSYTSSAGTLYKYSNGVLASYSNFTVNYSLNIATAGAYALKFSTAQWTSKFPPPGYLFNFNIKVDGILIANVNLNASKTLTLSDFIDLATLSAGNHTLTIQWTNDTHPTPYDANAAIKDLEIYKK